ncbi:MAG: hypothetical protein Q8K78_10550 [Planctomycetaceae bacterium]|nr:hypothetical protein [Planctomycetaceae bacterium]
MMERADTFRKEDLKTLLLRSATRDQRALLRQKSAIKAAKPGTVAHRRAEVTIIDLEERLQAVKPMIEKRRVTDGN